nr:VOC family protein [Kineococcus vitellinus]
MSATVLDTPDPIALAAFYRHLLGFETEEESPDWVELRDPRGGAGLSFQREEEHVRPVWPGRPGEQRMQTHLDVGVDDLEAAVAHAVAGGAAVAASQPQEGVRVMTDPDGHVFCLYLPGS